MTPRSTLTSMPIFRWGYIPNEVQKLDIYKRIADIQTDEETEEMLEELIDRFGDPPKPVENLLYIAKIKSLAHEVYMTEISQKPIP